MDAHQNADDLSLTELETLLQQKRRQRTRTAVKGFAAAEEALDQQGEIIEEQAANKPARSPDTWRGAYGGDRYFPSTQFGPLGKGHRDALNMGVLPLEGQGTSATRVIQEAQAPLARNRRLHGHLLLGIEAIALVGFLMILGAIYVRLQDLNRETSVLQQEQLAQIRVQIASLEPVWTRTELPTATPADSATPPASRQQARTEGEHLALAPAVWGTVTIPPTQPPHTATPSGVPTATPSGDPRRLTIPKLGVDAPVVEGDSAEELKRGVGHRLGTAQPGQQGNVVLAAHSDIYGEIFRNLGELTPGDEVFVYTETALFRYIVRSVETVSPDRGDLMGPTEDAVLTMITCTPYLVDTHRIVVVADLAE